jgi:hypothetical protein
MAGQEGGDPEVRDQQNLKHSAFGTQHSAKETFLVNRVIACDRVTAVIEESNPPGKLLLRSMARKASSAKRKMQGSKSNFGLRWHRINRKVFEAM